MTNYEKAIASAQKTANKTRCSVLVYRSTLKDNREEPHKQEYGVAFTLPMFGVRVGERILPEEEYEPEMHPAWAEWNAIVSSRKEATPEQLEAATKAAEEEGYGPFFKRIFE